MESATNGGVKSLRIWIPLLLLPCMAIARFLPEWIEDGPAMIWMSAAFGPFLISFVLMVWWLLASRAGWGEKFWGLFGLIGLLVATGVAMDASMRDAPMIVMTIPMGIAAFAVILVLLGGWLNRTRTVVALIAAALGFGFSTLLVNEGVWGDFSFGFRWRWQELPSQTAWNTTPTATASDTPVSESLKASVNAPEWSGFRGNQRDATVQNVVIETDWSKHPPQELWRIPVGSGWSSFAVAGNRVFTQEQRDQREVVACYDADTGKEIWASGIESRFFEALGGLGPRATPTVSGGFVYALGAEGPLRKLDAITGAEVWQVDLRAIAKREPPMWGFSCSPLVHEGLVVLHAAGKENLGIIAFDTTSGEVRWTAAAGEQSYGSLQSFDLMGETCLGLLSETGLLLIEPTQGQVRMNYAWPHMGYRALQPLLVGTHQMVIPTGLGSGTRLIDIEAAAAESAWQGKEVWTSRNLKPDFNDLVAHDGFIYGFDNSIFTCIDLKDGSRRWKGGRYGKGQVVLLPASQALLVLSEQGELVLLAATPDGHRELGKISALEGKTWNHPVVVGDRLFVRNATEAVAYRLKAITAQPNTPAVTE